MLQEYTVKRIILFCKRFGEIYSKSQATAISAALSFYVTLTFFPMMICLYTLLGNNYDRLKRLLDFLEGFLPGNAVGFLEEFINYIAENNRPAMLIAGIIVLLTFSSSAIRQFHNFIGVMQGGNKFSGISFYIFSVIFSVIFLAAVYFAILVMFTGENFLAWIETTFPFIEIPYDWKTIRYPLLGLVFFLFIQGLYSTSKRRTDMYSTALGSLLSTVNFVLITMLFSMFIAKSGNYPLVYGSLASIVLFMLWLYYCCQVICIGAVFNIAVRDSRMERLRAEYDIESL